MLSREEFIRISLEINLFFQRIMKEHLFFIETSLQRVEAANIDEARVLKESFEHLLAETVYYANGAISEDAIKSNEFVTPYTLDAENISSQLTGADLDTMITKRELQLTSNPRFDYGERLERIVCDLNNRTLNMLEEVIAFKKKLIDLSLECKILIALYVELLEHITREAIYYREILKALQQRKLPDKTICDELNFWNNIMGEHAQFIDGLLDPSERQLKDTAAGFAKKFEKLVKECVKSAEKEVLERSKDATVGIRDYKRAATIGSLGCEIKSIFAPLLADHVLREANHYLRVLNKLSD